MAGSSTKDGLWKAEEGEEEEEDEEEGEVEEDKDTE